MRILIVEDDERIAEALTDQHYVIDIASDGESELFVHLTSLLRGLKMSRLFAKK